MVDRPSCHVEFTWTPRHLSFAEIIRLNGQTPLPPYIKREVTLNDETTYQTVYSKNDGAVAAPTAGLHFTQNTFDDLHKKGIDIQHVTLFVSAGTFQPIKTEKVRDHQMHEEQVMVSMENVKSLITQKCVIAVGTTSMRTIESLYWWGIKLLHHGPCEFIIHQNDPETLISYETDKELVFSEILSFMESNGLKQISGSTSIFLLPGYKFRVCDGLITNYHQPKSTLILLIAAFLGKNWQKVYKEALQNNYRFLSYGDSSLLIP